MANPLPPMPRDPIGENHKWREWFNVVRNSIVGVAGSVPITHNSLSSTQGGTSTERYHLTLDQHTNLTDAGDTTLHYHATDRDSDNFTGTEWTDLTDGGGTTLHTHGHNSQTGLQGGTTDEYYHNTAHEDDLTDIIDTQWSTGVVGTGNLVTDGGSGTSDVAACSVLIRATDSDIADIAQYSVPSSTGLALTDQQDNYIYAEYNSGTPQYIATTTQRADTNTNVLIAHVYRDGTTLHINNYSIVRANDNLRRIALRFVEVEPTAHASGVMLSETGTRNVAITSGVMWQCTNRILIDAFDSSGAGTFTYAYDDGAGGWTEQTGQTQINNTQYDDGSGTLQTLTANRYAVAWVYCEVGDGDVVVLYGQGDYTLTQANASQSPSSVPPRISAQGFLIGKIVLQKSDDVFTSVESAFINQLTTSAVTDHAALSNLSWTGSGHTGTASKLAGFDGSGAASEYIIGTEAGEVAAGDHNHTGVYEPADATILKDADIGASVQAYDAQLDIWAGVAPAAGVATFLADPSSENLSAVLTDETGSGSAVFATAPTLTNATINASSNGDALTINNTGTGNCLVVNDVAGDTTPTVIDTAGRIINGHTTSIAGAGAVQRNVQNIGSSVVAGITNAVFNSTTTANSQVEFAKSASDTLGTHIVVTTGETLGEVRWSGSDGTNFIRAASIAAQVDGTPGTTDMPGRLVFRTTADGGTAPTEALRIDSSQRTLMKAAHAVAPLFANPSSGTTVTLTNATSHYQKTGAATIATLTINLPANPVDGQISSGGSRATITTLTVGSAGTATVVGAPTTLAASGYYEMIYEASTDIWYRKG